MSGGLDAFDLGGLDSFGDLSFASDLGSVVTDFGTEFMSSVPSLDAFQIPSFDVPSLGGFGEIGSLAGNASWFDTFNPGQILSSIPSISDFNLGSLTSSLPSLSSIKDIASTITNNLGGIAQAAQTGLVGLQKLAPSVSAVSSAFGIQNPINQIIQPVSSALSLAGGIASISTGIVSTAGKIIGAPLASAGNTTDPYGLNILSNAETDAMVARNTIPGFVNSLSDPGTTTGLPAGVSSQYTSTYNPDTGKWDVFNNVSSTTVQSGLTEQEAILAEQDLNINNGLTLNTLNTAATAEDPLAAAVAANQATNEDLPGPTEADVLAAINGQTTALTNQARGQQSVRALRNNKAQSSDWRVRLRLAPNSTYLYNDGQPGILQPLKLTDGVIFPYTPSIDTAYKANYDAYDLTHSNYRGYFYKGSYVDAVNVRAQFTAQDSKEADYLLAVIHFFRSVTKMFYGQDQQRGSPPPLVYLNGYGDYQFSEHPCVVSQFNYTLPPDVDYIRAQNSLSVNTNQLNNRLRNPIANNPLAYSVNRLLNSSLVQGALFPRPTLPGSGNLGNSSPTYVPTKMEISITLYPIQSRSQISNNFSVKGFANGNLLKGGFW